jgi:hypothetical protein
MGITRRAISKVCEELKEQSSTLVLGEREGE